MTQDWLTVDRAGLAKTLEGRPKAFVLFEAIQNAFDEQGVTFVNVDVARIPGSPSKGPASSTSLAYRNRDG